MYEFKRGNLALLNPPALSAVAAEYESAVRAVPPGEFDREYLGEPTPDEPADGLHECRCIDCRRWSRLNAACQVGLVANHIDGLAYPADAVHYCGPFVSKWE